VSIRRLRPGELMALAGAIAIFVSLALPWYSASPKALGAWSTFGPALAIMLAGALLAVALNVAILTERSTAIPMATVVWSTWGGIAAVVCAIVRVLERPDHATGIALGGWLALAGAIAVLLGSWLSMRDERTGAYEPAHVDAAPVPSPPRASSSSGA
jgi:hypothetical protein